MSKAYYQETGGVVQGCSFTDTIPGGIYKIATRIIVPADVTVTITDVAFENGCVITGEVLEATILK